jgi:DNA-binding transcriptional LysR family regulator
MDVRHLQTFKTIVEEGSFSQAAEKLQYAQSTVTLQIQQLETELGVELFDRQKKKVQLTPAGRTLADHATFVLRQLHLLQQSMAELSLGETGHLRIGVIEPLASQRLPDILLKFCQAFPKVRLTLETWGTRITSERVASGELELGISTPPPAHLGLAFEPLFIEPMVLLAPQHHPLALSTKEKIEIRELANQRILLTQPTCAYRELIERVLIEQGYNLYSGLEIGSQEALKRSVQKGLGVAILPLMAAKPLPQGTVLKELVQPELKIPFGLIRKAEPVGPERTLEAFIRLVRQAFQPDLHHPTANLERHPLVNTNTIRVG